MVLTLKIRQAIVYIATGMFFLVAAMAQLQGDGGPQAFVKATVACLVVTCLGIALVWVLEDAARKVAGPAPVPVPARAATAPAATERAGQG